MIHPWETLDAWLTRMGRRWADPKPADVAEPEEITKLRVQVEDLTEQRDRFRAALVATDAQGHQLADMFAQIDELQAENEKLRQGLPPSSDAEMRRMRVLVAAQADRLAALQRANMARDRW